MSEESFSPIRKPKELLATFSIPAEMLVFS